MLALASAMIMKPTCLLVDEPLLGLAPASVDLTLARFREIHASGDVAIVMVEQRLSEVLQLASRAILLRDGIVAYDGSPMFVPEDAVVGD
jgi:ABC-type branched-subunit amino acid transport system ATPase component